jgi:hypothetical protein
VDSILSVERHDYRELARVTLTDDAAAALRAWKTGTWQECYGYGTGETAGADGDVAELLAAVGDRVDALAKSLGWGEYAGGRHAVTGSYHAVIVGASGLLVHATAVGCREGRYYLAG